MKKRLIPAIILVILIVITFNGCGDKSEKNKTVLPEAEVITEKDMTEEETAEETTEEAENYNPRLCLYYSTGTEWNEKEITDCIGQDFDSAKVFSTPSEVKKETTNKISIKPEFRLYGIPKDAKVSVRYESEVTKAKTTSVRYNDGVQASYFYWSVKMYDFSLEGQYSFKVTIEEENKAEQYIYYKIAVQK